MHLVQLLPSPLPNACTQRPAPPATPVPEPGNPDTPLRYGFKPESPETVAFYTERINVHKKAWAEHASRLDEQRRQLRAAIDVTLQSIGFASDNIAKAEERCFAIAFEDVQMGGSDLLLPGVRVNVAWDSLWRFIPSNTSLKLAMAVQRGLFEQVTAQRAELFVLDKQLVKAQRTLYQLAGLPPQYQGHAEELVKLAATFTHEHMLVGLPPLRHPLEHDVVEEARGLYYSTPLGCGDAEDWYEDYATPFEGKYRRVVQQRMRLYTQRAMLTRSLYLAGQEPVVT